MTYHQILIYLYRPFVSEDNEATLNARENCTGSAGQICRLLNIYRRYYALRYFNIQAVAITMVAGVVHAHDCCVYSGSKGKLAQDNLLTCIQALGEMGQCFNSSIRGLEVITTLRRVWQNKMFVQKGPKRQRGTFSTVDRPTLGRRRTSSHAVES